MLAARGMLALAAAGTRGRTFGTTRAGLRIIELASVLDTISALAAFSALEGEIG